MGNEKYDFGQVDNLIEKDIVNGFPGAVLQISYQGRVIKHSAHGYKVRYDGNYKQLPNPEIMTPDTVFDMASNTKIFATTFAAMKMFENGFLDLDRPLVDYIPDFVTHNKITARMLLSHCSGYGPEIWFLIQRILKEKGFILKIRIILKICF